MKFTIEHQSKVCNARAGIIETKHGIIHTPIFMPVGTVGTVKAVEQRNLITDVNVDIILANTYHLYLTPGMDIIGKAGGLHNFINWDKPILTDSGGYQVYSLSKNRKLCEEGALFKSHIDGSSHMFTPESVIDIERTIGSDIMMVLDECTPFACGYEYTKQSIDRTHRWLKRAKEHFNNTKNEDNEYQSLFGIVQGSVYKDLRDISCDYVSSMDCDGNAIGGVCHTDGHLEQLYEVASWVCERLPKNKPRYFMGVGTPKDILECIPIGVDMFDCVMPTRCARNGRLFTTYGVINIKNKKWEADFSCLDNQLQSYVSNKYTKAYLHHLFKTHEILAYQIASLQNLCFYMWLIRNARLHIIADDYLQWKETILKTITQRL